MIRLIINSSLEDVFLMGLATRAICSYVPLSQLTAYQLETCVVEAINNVIRHSYGNNTGCQVEVSIYLFLDRIRFQICDRGKPMPPETLRSEFKYDPENIEDLPEGGMGLHVIKSVMDEVEYESKGGKNVLSMTKVFKPN